MNKLRKRKNECGGERERQRERGGGEREKE